MVPQFMPAPRRPFPVLYTASLLTGQGKKLGWGVQENPGSMHYESMLHAILPGSPVLL